MSCFDFSPYNLFFSFWSLQNILFFKIVPTGTILKNKTFCKDFLKNKNILQGTIFFKNGFGHHVPRVQIITKVEPGTKIKTRHIYRDQKL